MVVTVGGFGHLSRSQAYVRVLFQVQASKKNKASLVRETQFQSLQHNTVKWVKTSGGPMSEVKLILNLVVKLKSLGCYPNSSPTQIRVNPPSVVPVKNPHHGFRKEEWE